MSAKPIIVSQISDGQLIQNNIYILHDLENLDIYIFVPDLLEHIESKFKENP